MTCRSFEESRDDRPLPGYDAPPIGGNSYTTSLDAAGAITGARCRRALSAARTITDHTRAAANAQPDEFVVGYSLAISNRDVYALLAPATAAWSGTVQLGLCRGVVPQERLSSAVARYDTLRVAVCGDYTPT